ncbi:MAG: DUF362 domain-containing protein [Chloroflexota bacterium]|nr:DUF362 domain-containing protein [Chloroflexota bacterium]
MTKIYAGRCNSYQLQEVRTVLQAALVAFGGISTLIQPGERVLLKPNLLIRNTAERASTTHPAVMEAVIEQVLAAGGRPFIGDSPAFGTTQQVAETCGIAEVARRHGVEIVEFERPRRIRTSSGRYLTLEAKALEADKIINLSKFKSHQQLLLSGPVKNLFGCVNGKRKPLWHLRLGDRNEGTHFAQMLLDISAHLAPVWTLVDGIIAMEGNGPRNGTPRPLNLLLAGTDGVALERAMSEVIKLPFETPLLRAARESGFGQVDLAQIEVVGEPLAAFVKDDFKLPEMQPIFFSPNRVALSYLKGLLAKRRTG